jgi:hypothetical protein
MPCAERFLSVYGRLVDSGRDGTVLFFANTKEFDGTFERLAASGAKII